MSFGELAFTPVVKQLQEQHGSRKQYERIAARDMDEGFGDFERDFMEQRDSFYMSTVGETGWPYVQHRGGPVGFLKVIDAHTLAFADYSGNKQYISTGNLLTDDRAALILVDYPRQARMKILGHVEELEGAKAAEWLPKVRVTGYKATIERVFVIRVEAFDWNCPQHITPRYTAEEIRSAVAAVEEENAALKREIAELKAAS